MIPRGYGREGVTDRIANGKTVNITYRIELERRSLLAQQKPYFADLVFKG